MIPSAICFVPIVRPISKTYYGSIQIILWKGDLTSYKLCYNPCAFSSGLKFMAITVNIVCLFLARQPSVSQGLLIPEVSRSHATTHHSR